MISFNEVSFRYENSSANILENLTLEIGSGQCVLLCGESGCGKTTVTRLINGLIPHYYEGTLRGDVIVNGKDVTKAELYETARFVGSVFQNPRSQFFCVDTTSEIAFGCENAGLPEKNVEERMGEAVKELKISKLMNRNIFGLSGGEKQKIACASVAAIHPEVFVLDEPTSNLDVEAIQDLKEILKLWKSQGKTIIIAEHRLYWLKEVCDRVIYMKDGKVKFDIPMEQFKRFTVERIKALGLRSLSLDNIMIPSSKWNGTKEIILENFSFSYDKIDSLNIPHLSVPFGGVVAVIGHNGAGKSTFSKCICGLEKQFKGRVKIENKVYNKKQMLKKSYMVMQDVNHQLFCESVEDEVHLGMMEENSEKVEKTLYELDLYKHSQRHPMSLSGGQKQRVAIASALLAEKEILIFDEPTSGLDFTHMEQTAQLISSLQGKKTIFIVTHDPELIVRCCTHIMQLEYGKVINSYPLMKEHRKKFIDFFCISESTNMKGEIKIEKTK